MERAVRGTSRRNGETLIRSRQRVPFRQRCAMMRSKQRFAVATARKSHARVLHAPTGFRPA
eukprot:7349315-Lingulodinium_polyedra.AAC.1